jgi:hypothetical protein
MVRWMYVIIVLGLVLAACGGDDSEQPTADNTPNTVPTLSPIYVNLQRNYEQLQASHQAITGIWEGLATNEQIQCGSYPDVIAPETITAEDNASYQPLADLLRQAAIDLEQAINLWKAECTNPRTNPPPSVIDEGRLTARAAGDSLREAARWLDDIQE